ncbi:TadE/TadG family type IV pilus assembly protein [Sphingosinicella sp. BN140058]|uniref:TadE/TadG family type IV pilus assembly protein n=1 Tax=Sphingosinicella sp. BN140058 TaxID=1892855 RepID=UPI001013A4F3|nr:TadE/TadG family type IV pilus assembly protein [Sphingosinicella sp. BN140058]QAY78533.1 pilus assembly protein [Sphingosinicella sp. BN140058]
MLVTSAGFRLTTLLRKLRSSESGLAFVEFAMSLPIVLMISMYGLEIAWVAVQQQKVNQLAAVSADAAARVRSTIDETDLVEILTAAKVTGQQMKFAENGRLILSSVQLNAGGTGQWIRWQRCIGDLKVNGTYVPSKYGAQDAGKTDATLQGVGRTRSLVAPSGNAIIVAELTYNYQPLISNAFFGARVLKAETAYLVRDRTDLSISNNAPLAATDVRTCAVS